MTIIVWHSSTFHGVTPEWRIKIKMQRAKPDYLSVAMKVVFVWFVITTVNY